MDNLQNSMPISEESQDGASVQEQRLSVSPRIDPSIRPTDILCGRDKASFNHVGNRRFREHVMSAVEEYCEAENAYDRRLVVYNTLQTIRNDQGGRFFKKDAQTGQWFELSGEQAKEKVGRALRDAAHFQETKKSKGTTQKKRPLRKRKKPPPDSSAPAATATTSSGSVSLQEYSRARTTTTATRMPQFPPAHQRSPLSSPVPEMSSAIAAMAGAPAYQSASHVSSPNPAAATVTTTAATAAAPAKPETIISAESPAAAEGASALLHLQQRQQQPQRQPQQEEQQQPQQQPWSAASQLYQRSSAIVEPTRLAGPFASVQQQHASHARELAQQAKIQVGRTLRDATMFHQEPSTSDTKKPARSTGASKKPPPPPTPPQQTGDTDSLDSFVLMGDPSLHMPTAASLTARNPYEHYTPVTTTLTGHKKQPNLQQDPTLPAKARARTSASLQQQQHEQQHPIETRSRPLLDSSAASQAPLGAQTPAARAKPEFASSSESSDDYPLSATSEFSAIGFSHDNESASAPLTGSGSFPFASSFEQTPSDQKPSAASRRDQYQFLGTPAPVAHHDATTMPISRQSAQESELEERGNNRGLDDFMSRINRVLGPMLPSTSQEDHNDDEEDDPMEQEPYHGDNV